MVFDSFQQFSTVLVAYMRSIYRNVVCEPNQWATWLACSLNMWSTHCSLCLVQTGLFLVQARLENDGTRILSASHMSAVLVSPEFVSRTHCSYNCSLSTAF